MSSSEFSARLRLASMPLHRQLEQATGLPDKLASERDLSQLLKTFQAAYQVIDPVLSDATDMLVELPDYVRRYPILGTDLDALGHNDALTISTPEKLCHTIFDSSPMQRVGMRYVVEGSTFGGRIMMKHIRNSSWGQSVKSPLNFFRMEENPANVKWAEFRTCLDGKRYTNQQYGDITEGAQRIFGFLISCFSNATAQVDQRT